MDPPIPKQKWGPVPIIRTTAFDGRHLTNMEFVGTLPGRSNLKDDDLTYYRNESRHTHLYGGTADPLKEIAGSGYYVARPVRRNVENVIRSWDERKPTTYETEEAFKRGLSFLNKRYGILCKDSVASPEETLEFIDYTKSPGYPANMWGIKTKAELVKDKFYLDWQKNFQYSEIPIWIASPKREYLAKSDLDLKTNGGKEKLRLFTIPPYHLLYEQIRFGKRISLRCKDFGWSAYGFNPYRGGVHKLAQLLLSLPIRLFYDVSGWDKFLPLMRDIFTFIKTNNGYENFPKHIQVAFDWMSQNSTDYLIKMHDGTTYFKRYGNASGSGTTTRDNILAHIVIVAGFLSQAYFNKFGLWPSHELLSSQIVKLFGDDSIMALSYDFERVLDDGFLQSYFAQFGMTLKFVHGGDEFPLDKMQFLGFYFRKIGALWFPAYDAQRLATTMVYDGVDALNRESFVARSFILYFMSYASDEHQFFKLAYSTLLSNLAAHSDLTETEKTFLAIGILSEADIISLYQGFEGGLTAARFSFFLERQYMEEEGFRNPLRHVSQAEK